RSTQREPSSRRSQPLLQASASFSSPRLLCRLEEPLASSLGRGRNIMVVRPRCVASSGLSLLPQKRQRPRSRARAIVRSSFRSGMPLDEGLLLFGVASPLHDRHRVLTQLRSPCHASTRTSTRMKPKSPEVATPSATTLASTLGDRLAVSPTPRASVAV